MLNDLTPTGIKKQDLAAELFLLNYLRAWVSIAEATGDEQFIKAKVNQVWVIRQGYGLCSNLTAAVEAYQATHSPALLDTVQQLFSDLLRRDFPYQQDGRTYTNPYPWGQERYNDAQYNPRGQFDDELRTAWCKKIINEIQGQVLPKLYANYLQWWLSARLRHLAQVDVAPRHFLFNGLCKGFANWVVENNTGVLDVHSLILAEFNGKKHPFNASAKAFREESKAGMIVHNAGRVAYVERRLLELTYGS